MRLVTLANGGRPRAGAVAADKILDLTACIAALPEARGLPSSVRGVLEGGDAALDLARSVLDRVLTAGPALAERLAEEGALIDAADAELLAPLPDPRLVLSCGQNYGAHLREMGGNIPPVPSGFLKNVNAIIGPGAPIVLPAEFPDMVDWEAEFCGVIGRPCHRVSIEEALDYVAGYTMVNDVSARNWAQPMEGLSGMEASRRRDQNLLGKQFPSFCPMGPAVATRDEIDPTRAAFSLKVNGQIKQNAVTDDLVFSLAYLIAHFSRFYRFMPGDVITTGSPSGVGMGHKPWVFLKPGDVVEIQADSIGTMTNPVVAGA